MAFDGFVTKAVVSELKTILIGAKVNKVFQPNKNEIILGLYNSGSNYALDLCTIPDLCRICLTTHSKPNPQNAFNFCMLLRKYLVGGKIVKISSYDLERTVEIQFECYNELNDLVVRKLFIEIMSRQSNIILTNEKNIIIDTLKHFDNQVRELLPAHEFQFVPINKISFLEQTADSFAKIIEEHQNEFSTDISIANHQTKNPSEISIETTLSKNLSEILLEHFIGFSKPFIHEIIEELQINNTSYTHEDLTKLFEHIQNIIQHLGSSMVSCKPLGEKDYTLVLKEASEPLNINFFIDDFYFDKEQDSNFKNLRNSLLKIIASSLKKVSKKLANIDCKLKECENMDTYKLYGELLTANLYKLNSSINLDKVELENYYDNYNKILIPLDKTISVQQNIEKYFKKYNKLKNALIVVSAQKKEAEKELNYIESIVFSLENAKNIHDINEVYEEISENISIKKDIDKNKQQPSKKKNSNNEIEFETKELDGFTIYIGKNNIQNDYISLKLADKNDIWFHTQKIHGSHVLLRNPENLELSDIPENVLFTCASLAKENSKASTSVNVCVDYCLAKFVKKASGAKPGMVIYTNFKTIIVR